MAESYQAFNIMNVSNVEITGGLLVGDWNAHLGSSGGKMIITLDSVPGGCGTGGGTGGIISS